MGHHGAVFWCFFSAFFEVFPEQQMEAKVDFLFFNPNGECSRCRSSKLQKRPFSSFGGSM